MPHRRYSTNMSPIVNTHENVNAQDMSSNTLDHKLEKPQVISDIATTKDDLYDQDYPDFPIHTNI